MAFNREAALVARLQLPPPPSPAPFSSMSGNLSVEDALDAFKVGERVTVNYGTRDVRGHYTEPALFGDGRRHAG